MTESARMRFELIATKISIEIVDRTNAEVVLFWDCTRPQLRKMREALIADLDQLSAEEFLVAWESVAPTDFA